MQTMNNDHSRYDDEIDLCELWNILFKNKLTIFIITAVITFAATIYAFNATKIYHVSALMQIGSYKDSKIFGGYKTTKLGDTNELVQELNFIFIKPFENIKNKQTNVTKIRAPKEAKGFIKIEVEAISNQLAINRLNTIVNFVKDKHKKIIDGIKNNKQLTIKNLQFKIKSINEVAIKNINNKIQLIKTQNIARIDEKIKFIKELQIPSINQKIKNNINKIKEYKKDINNINRNKTNSSTAAIILMQTLNYQHLIIEMQNTIPNLKLEVERLASETIADLNRDKNEIYVYTLSKLKYKVSVDLINDKSNLQKKISSLKYLIKYGMINSRIVGKILTSNHPVQPKKILIIIVAAITSLILAIFFIFFRDFIRSKK